MAQIRVLCALTILALSGLACGSEELKPLVRQRRQSVLEWSEQEVQQVLGGFSFPSVSQYVPGGSWTLSRCLTTPPNLRVATYSPSIDAAIDVVYGNVVGNDGLLQGLREFLNSAEVYDIVQEYSLQVDSYASVGELLEVIFQYALQDDDVIANNDWYDAIQYFQGQITYGGPPISQVDNINLDLAGVFESFDFGYLNTNPDAVQALEVVLNYLSSSSNILDEFLSEAQWSSYDTRGALLYDLLSWLQGAAGPQEMVDSVQDLLPYVLVDSGAGLGPIYCQVCSGPGPVGPVFSVAQRSQGGLKRPLRKGKAGIRGRGPKKHLRSKQPHHDLPSKTRTPRTRSDGRRNTFNRG